MPIIKYDLSIKNDIHYIDLEPHSYILYLYCFHDNDVLITSKYFPIPILHKKDIGNNVSIMYIKSI